MALRSDPLLDALACVAERVHAAQGALDEAEGELVRAIAEARAAQHGYRRIARRVARATAAPLDTHSVALQAERLRKKFDRTRCPGKAGAGASAVAAKAALCVTKEMTTMTSKTMIRRRTICTTIEEFGDRDEAALDETPALARVPLAGTGSGVGDCGCPPPSSLAEADAPDPDDDTEDDAEDDDTDGDD